MKQPTKLGLFVLTTLLTAASNSSATEQDWPKYGFNYANTNHNPQESLLNATTAKHLVRRWETFNDDSRVTEPRPTNFVLESVLGLEFPSAVVGVVASPIIRNNTIYYVDALGTLFARDAATGTITNTHKHWTTTLVDPDFSNGNPAVLPELVYTAPIVTKTHVWVLGSSYGRVHAVDRRTGVEVDFKPDTPSIDPFPIISDLPFASILGDSVIVRTPPAQGNRDLLITGVNVILNDALVQGAESGVQIAIDITDPAQPVEAWRRFMVDVNPATGLRYSAGVSAGAGLAVDRGRHLIFGGTGQNTAVPYPEYPDPNAAPTGFVDRSDSLYAIDYLTGEIAWFNQFHRGDVFSLSAPVSTGPNQVQGPRDADVLSPPVLWRAQLGNRTIPMVGVGSKGGRYRAVNRNTGATIWTREIAKPTGIGGIQAGAAYANGVVYVAGFEGLDDGFSDAQFGTSFDTGKYGNAFFATFSPAFWADVEDTRADADPSTGMRIKVYALDATTGESLWRSRQGEDFVALNAGAALRHVSIANGLVYVTSSSGQLIVLRADTGTLVFTDQTADLNKTLLLGLGKPHHASMNTGALISSGRVYVGYGAQNNPSGGVIAYGINRFPAALDLLAQLRGDIQQLTTYRFVRGLLLLHTALIEQALEQEQEQRALRKLRSLQLAVRFFARQEALQAGAAKRLTEAGEFIEQVLREAK